MTAGLSRRRGEDIAGIGCPMEDIATGESRSVDPRLLFDHPNRPLELELGTGKGTFLVQQAVRQPDTNFLGIEWAAPFFRCAADRLRRHGLTNTRMLHGDGREFATYWCADSIADAVHLYFLDPWPKSRHHKRRVVQTESMRHFHRILQPGGKLHLVTDHVDLWSWYRLHIDGASDLFHEQAFESPASAEPGEVIGTNFERKYRKEGRTFNAATLIKH